MYVGRSRHAGQQIGLPSRVGRQIGVEWVVSIGDGCAQNRSMRLDTSSERRLRLRLRYCRCLWSRDRETVVYGVWARYLHLLCDGVEPAPGWWSGGYDVVGNRECARIWESRDRGT
jgi:hypothetical protein